MGRKILWIVNLMSKSRGLIVEDWKETAQGFLIRLE